MERLTGEHPQPHSAHSCPHPSLAAGMASSSWMATARCLEPSAATRARCCTRCAWIKGVEGGREGWVWAPSAAPRARGVDPFHCARPRAPPASPQPHPALPPAVPCPPPPSRTGVCGPAQEARPRRAVCAALCSAAHGEAAQLCPQGEPPPRGAPCSPLLAAQRLDPPATAPASQPASPPSPRPPPHPPHNPPTHRLPSWLCSSSSPTTAPTLLGWCWLALPTSRPSCLSQTCSTRACKRSSSRWWMCRTVRGAE